MCRAGIFWLLTRKITARAPATFKRGQVAERISWQAPESPRHVERQILSSREIAELCEKQHKHVLRDIKAMLGQITKPKFGPSDFVSSYKDATGRNLKEYRLPKDLTMTLITGYRADLRYKVIKRLEELEGQTRGHHALIMSPEIIELIERTFGISRMSVRKVTATGRGPARNLCGGGVTVSQTPVWRNYRLACGKDGVASTGRPISRLLRANN